MKNYTAFILFFKKNYYVNFIVEIMKSSSGSKQLSQSGIKRDIFVIAGACAGILIILAIVIIAVRIKKSKRYVRHFTHKHADMHIMFLSLPLMVAQCIQAFLLIYEFLLWKYTNQLYSFSCITPLQFIPSIY